MKALTLIQPWASLITLGLKHYETRSWKTPYRGRVLIHAGKKLDREFICDLQRTGTLPPTETVPCGVLLGAAEITAMLSTNDFDPGLPESRYGDYSPDRWAWKLENVEAFDIPIACKGMLGLWEVPDYVLAEVNLCN